MSESQIEREIFIAAAPERVWSLVAEPGFWASDDDSIRGTQAREGESFLARHSEHGEFPMRVETVDAPHFLAYRWNSAFPGEELREENSTLVEFTLTAEAGGTRLRVVESEFAALPTSEQNRSNVIKDHTGGWESCLTTIADRAA